MLCILEEKQKILQTKLNFDFFRMPELQILKNLLALKKASTINALFFIYDAICQLYLNKTGREARIVFKM